MRVFTAVMIAASSSLAWGQSNVTIYGFVDQGISRGNGGGAANDGANGSSKAWLVRQSRSSRVGFRGTEDLGGGLSAEFQIEHRFTPDTAWPTASSGPAVPGCS